MCVGTIQIILCFHGLFLNVCDRLNRVVWYCSGVNKHNKIQAVAQKIHTDLVVTSYLHKIWVSNSQYPNTLCISMYMKVLRTNAIKRDGKQVG